MRRRHLLPFGAEMVSSGVRFRMWAPAAKAVALLLEEVDLSNPQPAGAFGPPAPSHSAKERPSDRLPIPMHPEPDGWWSVTTARAAAGSRYCYRVDGIAVPDPASRFQPDGVHNASEVIDPGSYRWTDEGWRGRAWEQLVIYELHVGTFSESGDFAGAIGHLDDLVELGVTAVELMPIAAFPGGRNWGYDGVQLFAPYSAYGSPEDLKRLVEACHAHGLAILLDVVYNHFGPEGNYLHVIAGDFFTERHHTPWGAAINYDGPMSRPVRDFMLHNALYWIEEYHFDGLRLDAVHAIADDTDPDILTEIANAVHQRITGREVHLVLENDNNEARRLARRDDRASLYSGQWNDDLHHALHVLLTGQTSGYYGDYGERPIIHLGRALAHGFAYQGERSPYRDGRLRGEPSEDLPATAFVSFLQNHDQIGNTPFGLRIAALAPEKLVHAAATIVLLSPQIPLLFMGEEWASERPFLFFCDFEPALAAAVRQGRRREFAQYPEFSDPAAQDRLPDATAEESLTASRLDWPARRREPHAAWLTRYRRLLEVRAREIVPRLRGMSPGGEFCQLGRAALRVEWQLGDGSTLLLLANFARGAVPLGRPAPRDGLLYCTESITPATDLAASCAAFYLLPATVSATR